MSVQELNYDIERKEIPVTIGGKKYKLVEPDGESINKWRNVGAKSLRLGPDGRPVGVSDVGETEPLLISLCLYTLSDSGELRLDRDGNPDIRYRVGKDRVTKFPYRVQEDLAKQCIKLAGLRGDDDLDALYKQRDEITERIKELEEKAAGFDPDEEEAKN